METVLDHTKKLPKSFCKSFKLENNGMEIERTIRINSNRFISIFKDDTLIYVENTDDSFIFASNILFDIYLTSEDHEALIKFPQSDKS